MANESVIRMPRRFDYSAGIGFNQQLNSILAKPGLVTLDGTDLEYIDSAGIGILVMSQKRAQASHSKIVLSNLRPAPREILHLANLQKVIEII